MSAKPKSEIMARLRKERKKAGLEEVRGVWLPKHLHKKLKDLADSLNNEDRHS